MKIRTKLTLAFLGCGLVPLLIASFLSFRIGQSGMENIEIQGGEALKKAAFNQLTALRDAKKTEVQGYFERTREDLDLLAEKVGVLEKEAFAKLSAVQQIKLRQVERLFETMRRDVRMLAASEDALAAFRDFKRYHDERNTGEHEGLAIDTDVYRQLYDKWYPKLEK